LADAGGTDTVSIGSTYSIEGRLDLDNITLTGTSSLKATGNVNVNILEGNAGANTLDGKGGTDTLKGGAGNDIYIIDDVTVVIDETTGSGLDIVRSTVSYSLDQLTSQSIENLTLLGTATDGTGNGSVNIILGNALDNVIDGAGGADTMSGGAGNDTYFVDNGGDLVKDSSGIDTVSSSMLFYLLPSAIENLVLAGTIDSSGTGNSLANIMVGNDGDNTLNGGTGADTLSGGAGDDTYVLDNVGDIVFEAAGEGDADTVMTKYSYTLGANVENLTLTGTSSVSGTGNTLDNEIIGNTGANILDGGDGDDTLDGGAGKDTLTGGNGEDQFVFHFATAYASIDIIKDFDVLDDVLFFDDLWIGLDPLFDVADDYVEYRHSGSDTLVFVDSDGLGTDFGFKQIAVIEGVLL
jgi:trimeric autotransporter adhesin